MATISVNCGQCGGAFECRPHDVQRGRKYCSQRCCKAAYSAAHSVDLVCGQCAKPFKVTGKHAARGQRFCRAACSAMASRKYDGPSSIACGVCGKSIKVSPCDVRNGKRFCGVECMGIAKQVNPDIPSFLTVPCGTCGQPFEARWFTGRNERQRFCSRDCSSRAHGALMSGPANPNRKPKVSCTCGNCGKVFDKYPCRVSGNVKRKGDFCSKNCAIVHRLTRKDDRTDIEILTAAMLTEAGIDFREQVPMCERWVVDFLVEDWKLVIFSDGEYWHDKPKVAAKDRGQTRYLEKCGWGVVRLRGNDIKSDPAGCLRRILAYRPPAVPG